MGAKGGRRVLGAWPSACLCAFALSWASLAWAQDSRIPWKDYDEALRDAQKSGKPVFLYFFIDNCMYCRKMDGQTLVARGVVDYLKDNFVSVRIKGEKAPQLVRKYMVRGFPTSWFLTPDGKAISSLPGYLGPEEFSRVLRYIGGGHYRSKSLKEYLGGS
ncbi:MAG: thioredoxin family protein [Thermodesulfobacteriota bacterium]